MRIQAIAACTLAVGVLAMPTAVADPTGTLPPMTATNGGPIIGGGGAASQMSQQLKSLNDPNVQEVDGPDAAQFIAAAAGISDRDLASPFMALQRALGCQKNNAGFGARAYRRNDGQWGGAMLVIPKSAYPDTDAMKACEMSNWRRPSLGSSTSMCNGGWAYPPQTFNNKGGDYVVLLAGTNTDFCTALNGNYKTTASAWP
ncbi:hypothetical protein A5647_18130 [Mycobacterium sp. 1100029.7]|nr:hypothetical protein A5647_18130 [Mycobacterium sp. 1100029.7]